MRGATPALAAALVAVSGCGGSGDASSALVRPGKPPPVVGFDAAASGDTFLISTNRGLYRVTGGEAERIRASARTPDGHTPVGTFLAFLTDDQRELAGSGHPDRRGQTANFLGFMTSGDGGRSWRVRSRYGFSDLHVLREAHGRIYAADALVGAIAVSRDGGRRWRERPGPPGRTVDFVVDPSDPETLIAATEEALFRSDGGDWSALPAEAGRLAWPAPGALYRATGSGRIYLSEDGGDSWEIVGLVDGEPMRLDAVAPDHLFAALADASILESADGGREWGEVFSP